MTHCEDCALASNGRVHPLEWNRFNPACMDCGARMVCCIRRMRSVPEKQRSARMKAVVDDWVKWGHDEQALRERCTRDWKAWATWAEEWRRDRSRM